MIFFMKKMRRHMVTKEQFWKYLLYAMGETIVVMLGVFLAFQLNMNARDAADEVTEINYLQGIVVDIDQDIVELTNLLQFDTAQLSAFTTIQKAFLSGPDKGAPALATSIGTANLFTNFNGNSLFFEDMKSSGKITLISSDEFSRPAFSWESGPQNSTRSISVSSTKILKARRSESLLIVCP